MSESSQHQETNKLWCQKKVQKVAQDKRKARNHQIIKENRLNRKNQIELESSDSLTEYQKEERREFIRYLQRDFFKKRHSDKTAEDLVLSEYSFQFQALNPEIQTFMNDVITGNIQISSSEDYSAKIKNLLEKINNEVFLSSELPKVDNSQSWAPTNLYQEMSGPRILQNSMPLQGYIDDFTNMLKTGFNGILNNHQAEAEVEVEAEGYSNDIQCRIEYCQIEIEELKPFLINFLDSFTGKEISLPRKGMDKYSPVERVHVNDKFGLWTYDPLQGCIDISFRSADGGPLQKKITLEKNFFKNNPRSVVTIQRQYEPTEESKRNDSDMSLEDFLKKVVEINGKERKSVQEWIKKLNLNDVHRLEEIFAWVDDDWKQASLSVGAKKLIQTHLNQFRVNTDKSQEAHELTKAEKYAVVHRIKRFLIWKTHPKELKNVPYIDKRALEAGFQEIKKKYAGHDLLSELERFYKCFTIPKSYSESMMFNRGLLLYGPPGTGKSELTKVLPSKIGLTPISYALSAAEVNRPHVGETEMVLEALCARATKIPYVWCCAAVDEIDVLAPKRDEKSSEHKISSLGTLLALIGGIKDVSNLMFLASTNRLPQIDEAFRRRMSGQFFVGRPSPQARLQIFKASDKTFLNDNMIDQLVNLTANFSGSALLQYIYYIVSETKNFNEIQQSSQQSLSYEKLAELAAVTSKQFNIRLGSYSLPELFLKQSQNQSLLGSSFLSLLEENNILLLNFETKNVEVLYERDCTPKPTISNQKPAKIVKLGHLKLLNSLCQGPRDFIMNLQLPQPNSKSKIEFFVDFVDLLEVRRFQKIDIHNFFTKKVQDLKKEADLNPSRKCILVWLDVLEQAASSGVDQNIIKSWFQANLEALGQKKNHYHFFATSEPSRSDMIKMIYRKGLALLNKQEINFSGRIMIDTSEEEPEIRFETDGKEGSEGLYRQPLLFDNSSGLNTYQVITSLVEFASERKIDFIFLMDQDFLLSNNAFDDSKTKEHIAEKMEEFKSYPRSLLIIDVDSIVGMVKSVSESSMGPSTSYSLSDPKLYNMVIHYARSIPQILPASEYWIALISRNKELSKMIKKDLAWPITLKENEEMKKEEEKQKEKICLRCGETYIEAKDELNHCTYHGGFLFESSAPSYEWEIIEDVEQAKELAFKKNAIQKKSASNQMSQNKEVQFSYICCLEPLNSQGCKKSKHISDKNLLIQSKNAVRQKYEEKFNNLKFGLDSI